MKKFLATYVGTEAALEKSQWKQLDAEKRRELEASGVLFENHPHFSIFPGDSVEIMECLPLPE